MRILTRNIAIREEQNWLETLKNAISDPKILLKTLNLPVEDFAEDIAARKLFAMRVPLPFVEKMEKGNLFLEYGNGYIIIPISRTYLKVIREVFKNRLAG